MMNEYGAIHGRTPQAKCGECANCRRCLAVWEPLGISKRKFLGYQCALTYPVGEKCKRFD